MAWLGSRRSVRAVLASTIGQILRFPVLQPSHRPSRRLIPSRHRRPRAHIRVAAELAAGLRFVHDANVIHLDLKPANIFLTAEGRLKLGDFGMASLWPRPAPAGEAQLVAGAKPAGFEREGDKLYLAPEVLQGRYGKAADVFSLGMTLLEAASNIVVPDQYVPRSSLS